MKFGYLHGALLCLASAIIWGVTFSIIPSVLTQIDPFTITVIRYTLALPLFLIALFVLEGKKSFKMPAEKKLLLWFLGSVGFAGNGFLMAFGQKMAGADGAIKASVMTATMPILGVIISYILKKGRPSKSSLIFILLSFCGVVLVITKGHILTLLNSPDSYLSDLLMLIGAFCWVFYTIIGSENFSGWSPLRYTTISILYGLTTVYLAEIICLATGIIHLPSQAQIYSVWGELVYISIASGFLGILFWNMGNKIIKPVNGVLFVNAVPITAFVFAAICGIIPNSMQMIGASITICALILNNLIQRKN
jgi:drug/metabolite transporter (DMT)-like permease